MGSIPSDYKKLLADNSVRAELVEDQGESRYKITDVIGKLQVMGSIPSDYKKLLADNSVRAELVEDQGESRYKITDVLGKL